MTHALTDEQLRNRRLADRITAGTAVPGLDEVMVEVRRMAGAYLDVPGPRAAQLCDEIDRLRQVLAALADDPATGTVQRAVIEAALRPPTS